MKITNIALWKLLTHILKQLKEEGVEFLRFNMVLEIFETLPPRLRYLTRTLDSCVKKFENSITNQNGLDVFSRNFIRYINIVVN